MDGYSHGSNPWLKGGLAGLGLVVLFSALVTGIILLLLPAVFFPKNVENAARRHKSRYVACGLDRRADTLSACSLAC